MQRAPCCGLRRLRVDTARMGNKVVGDSSCWLAFRRGRCFGGQDQREEAPYHMRPDGRGKAGVHRKGQSQSRPLNPRKPSALPARHPYRATASAAGAEVSVLPLGGGDRQAAASLASELARTSEQPSAIFTSSDGRPATPASPAAGFTAQVLDFESKFQSHCVFCANLACVLLTNHLPRSCQVRSH